MGFCAMGFCAMGATGLKLGGGVVTNVGVTDWGVEQNTLECTTAGFEEELLVVLLICWGVFISIDGGNIRGGALKTLAFGCCCIIYLTSGAYRFCLLICIALEGVELFNCCSLKQSCKMVLTFNLSTSAWLNSFCSFSISVFISMIFSLLNGTGYNYSNNFILFLSAILSSSKSLLASINICLVFFQSTLSRDL